MAKPFNDEGGSGFHLHVSLTDEAGRTCSATRTASTGCPRSGEHAIAGVLQHAAGARGAANPTINSYKRFGPDTPGALADRLGPGQPQRDGAHPARARRRGARMEVRLGDATANPYLIVAAIAAAAYLGIRDKRRTAARAGGLRLRPGQAAPHAAADAARRARRAGSRHRPSPRCSAQLLRRSFLAYKRNEVERFERFVTDWEFREYAYHL